MQENLDNIIGILNQLKNDYDRHENGISRDKMTPHEKALDIIEYDYMRFYNHDQWLAALKSYMTEDEAEIWCAFPEFEIGCTGATASEVKAKLPPQLASQVDAVLARFLKDQFIIDVGGTYTRTYLLLMITYTCINYNGSPLHKATIDWWHKVIADHDESKKYRVSSTIGRVIPHEGTLTGDKAYGRIPMNLDIPDKRQVLDIDECSAMLARCSRFAVLECICRKGMELAGARECDYPIDVCLLFDESAAGGIALGLAKEITYDDAMDIIRSCRDQGLVQFISNAEHPQTLCNCCNCCCLAIRTLIRGEHNLSEPSRFIVDVAHSDQCIQCGQCMKVCPADVLDVHETYVGLNTAKCIGCGLCVSKCPKSVLRMIPKPGAPDKLARQRIRRNYI